MNCRFCNNHLTATLVDLGESPPSNSFIDPSNASKAEAVYPLKVMVCESCWLVQVGEFKKATEIFDSDYIYFSSFSTSWLAHSRKYVEMMTERFGIGKSSFVVEIASNDGYLLQYFLEKSIPVLGIEPTGSTAEVSRKKGIETIGEFFGVDLATKLKSQGRQADLLLGNNVLAHVPDINDFVGGLKILLKRDGVITMEFPHLLKLLEQTQFDTIYHEHFSYLSLYTVREIFGLHGLEIFDVQEIGTHGGSLRIFAKHIDTQNFQILPSVDSLVKREEQAGMRSVTAYLGFQQKVEAIKSELLEFLNEQKANGKKVVAYGAAAKGNTLLNYSNLNSSQLEYVCDASSYKIGKLLPGSKIPVVSEVRILEDRPDFILILPWNISQEIMDHLAYVRKWGAKFVTAIPKLRIV